jgi:hypothetical protein
VVTEAIYSKVAQAYGLALFESTLKALNEPVEEFDSQLYKYG